MDKIAVPDVLESY